jgi:hypothetical protein
MLLDLDAAQRRAQTPDSQSSRRGHLPAETRERLSNILGADRFTAELESEIADALTIRDRDDFLPKFEAAERVFKAITTLQLLIKRADAQWGIERHDATSEAQRNAFVSGSWGQALTEPLAMAEASLGGWVGLRRPLKRRRGAPHDHEAVVRYRVLAALQDADVSIEHYRGQAAEVLVVVMEELDRLLGRARRLRADRFKKAQWARWIADVRELECLRIQHFGDLRK